jgi:filamentous hemagglutinin family protein
MNYFRSLVSLRHLSLLLVVLGCWSADLSNRAIAQITPDSTLPSNSVITPPAPTRMITGGTRPAGGNNLFHSFSEFSIPSNNIVFFNNAPDIRNIFTRVTGSSLSSIDGIIRANGTVNFFLLNPNGIIFGPNAQISVGGSFIGSTADRLRFEDGFEFSASNPAAALLTISAPVGLQFGANPGAIQVNGRGHQASIPTDNPGIALIGQTLGLVGGDVTFNSGIVTALSGRVEVGSVQSGFVSLTPDPFGFRLGYEQVQDFGSIQLNNRSALFNPAQGANPSGGIQVQGGQIALNNSQIVGVNDGSSVTGNVEVRASESLILAGSNTIAFPFSSQILNQLAPNATGRSGNVQITTPRLSVSDGAFLGTSSFGSGAIGDVRINAGSILVSGASPVVARSNSTIGSITNTSGNGGNVDITATDITVQNGGSLGTLATASATGNAGNTRITASDAITVSGSTPLSASTIGSGSYGAGNSGSLTIDTNRLAIQDGGLVISETRSNTRSGDITITADTVTGRGVNPFRLTSRNPSGIYSINYGSQPGSNVTLTTRRLDLADGVAVSSLAARSRILNDPTYTGDGTGRAGNVVVNASESIVLSGFSSNSPDVPTSIISNTFTAGQAGDVTVSTPTILLQDGAAISSVVVPFLSSRGEPLQRFPGLCSTVAAIGKPVAKMLRIHQI